MNQPFKYNGISFNTEWASKLSEAEFVKEFTEGRPADNLDKKQQENFAKFQAPHELSAVQLKEAHGLIKEYVNNQKPKVESAAVPTAASSSASVGANKGTGSKS